MLEVSGLRVASGAMIRVDGLGLSLPERRLHCAVGTERGGKNRQRRSHHRPAAEVGRTGDLRRRRHHASRGRAEWFVAAWRWFRSCASFSPIFRFTKRCLPAATLRAAGPAIPFDAVYDLFPRLAERRKPACRLALRGRAADACDRTRTGHQPKGDAARRAIGRTCRWHRAGFRRCGQAHPRHRVAILLVEQNLDIAATLADSCIVLAAGGWSGAVPPARPPAMRKFAKLILRDLSPKHRRRHSGTRAQRGSPEPITTSSEFMVKPVAMVSGLAALRRPGMTSSLTSSYLRKRSAR